MKSLFTWHRVKFINILTLKYIVHDYRIKKYNIHFLPVSGALKNKSQPGCPLPNFKKNQINIGEAKENHSSSNWNHYGEVREEIREVVGSFNIFVGRQLNTLYFVF